MSPALSKQARNVMALANEAARSLGHTYVGTEHILLGLVEQGSGVPDILATLGIRAEDVRAQIEKMVKRGSDQVARQSLPLTPRSKRVISRAGDEALSFNERCIGPEHLLLGLLCEEQGVACQVLLNLGVKPDELRAEVFRVRLAQMKIVERAVRPVRASTPRKRKMREELLAHFSRIYDQEEARLGNPSAALEAAANRFGDPKQLADELEAALPMRERISHFIERWFAWRAPESTRQYALRQAVLAFCILATVLPIVFVGVVLRFGWFENVWTLIRTLSAIVIVTPPAQFVITLATIKLRDSLWGVFGSRKSIARALLLDAAIAMVIATAFIVLAWAIRWSLSVAVELLEIAAIVGVVGATVSLILIRLFGQATIRDTMWAMLDIDAA